MPVLPAFLWQTLYIKIQHSLFAKMRMSKTVLSRLSIEEMKFRMMLKFRIIAKIILLFLLFKSICMGNFSSSHLSQRRQARLHIDKIKKLSETQEMRMVCFLHIHSFDEQEFVKF